MVDDPHLSSNSHSYCTNCETLFSVCKPFLHLWRSAKELPTTTTQIRVKRSQMQNLDKSGWGMGGGEAK